MKELKWRKWLHLTHSQDTKLITPLLLKQGRRSRVGRVGHGPPNSQARVFFLPLYRDIEHQERSVDRHSHSCSGPSLVPRRLGTRLIIVPRHPYHVVPACPLKYGDRESLFTLAETSRFRRRNLVQEKGLANHSGSLTTHSFTTTWKGTLFSVTLV